MKKPRDVIQPRGGVYAFARSRAQDEKAAIERALKEIELPKRSQFRISVRREEKLRRRRCLKMRMSQWNFYEVGV